MDIKKMVPWNWFKKEEEDASKTVPVRREAAQEKSDLPRRPSEYWNREFEGLFDKVFRGFGLMPFGMDQSLLHRQSNGWLKPTLDLGATDKEYTLTLEIPGVDEKDVKLEIVNDILTVRGEKKQEQEEKGKNFYRMERSYGSFQRQLSLPDDVDQDNVAATFKKGVLSVTMPRKPLPKVNARQIEVVSA